MIVGIDEVGRGCWAGPLVAGAVMLREDVPGLRDSKKLTKRQRERLAEEIYRSGAAVGLGWVSASEVDDLGLTEAIRLAMQRALDMLPLTYDEIVIDGNINFLAHIAGSRAMIKADDAVAAVSAASIAAKVARDKFMEQLASDYPGYGFEKHVGYGTADHIASLRSLGVSDMHRKSYKPIKALLELA